jgi:hypothetical protein
LRTQPSKQRRKRERELRNGLQNCSLQEQGQPMGGGQGQPMWGGEPVWGEQPMQGSPDARGKRRRTGTCDPPLHSFE